MSQQIFGGEFPGLINIFDFKRKVEEEYADDLRVQVPPCHPPGHVYLTGLFLHVPLKASDQLVLGEVSIHPGLLDKNKEGGMGFQPEGLVWRVLGLAVMVVGGVS